MSAACQRRPRRGIVRAVMTTATIRAFALALAASLLPATAGAADAPSEPVVKGSVLYREKDALPANAQVRVQLVDATPGEDAKVMAETTFATQGRQVPIPFALPFDPAKLDAASPHALRAYILIEGRVAYVTRARVNIDPKAVPVSVSILLTPGNADPVAVDSPAPAGAVKAPQPQQRRSNQRGIGQSRQQQQLQREMQRQLQEQQVQPPPPAQPQPAPPPKG
jgi:putative lipoprotein